ncbi:WASH complex subunit 3-like [Pecten maximus]|uniref:WASH complex subunit 3-like n=1 Tax=Pecten maximus TaxID=6579 RepID=UPI001458BC99|nr:WASH complex subunit 3-like [Pecten maximus]
MDADGLPLVGPGVDYTKVEAIHQKRTLAFLNHFVSHTASFLNRFSCVCEEKLDHMSSRLQQLEITMNILEAKLTSIPGLENITAPTSGSTAAPDVPTSAPQSTNSAGQQAGDNQQGVPPPPDVPEVAPVPVEEEKPDNPVSKDPRYAKYFKMLQVGVPEAAIRPKMKMDGLNPDLLSTPDAPAPPAKKSDDSDDDFSDESDSFSD